MSMRKNKDKQMKKLVNLIIGKTKPPPKFKVPEMEKGKKRKWKLKISK